MADKVFRLIIDVDSRKAKAGAETAEKGMAKFGARVASVTRLAGGLGLAFGGLQLAAAFKQGLTAALEFDRSLTRINTLVGVSKDVVNEWGDDLGRIAKETAVSANLLADALFAVTSAGARGKEAMEILEASAKAAAVGLGDVTSIARTTGAAMQAYKASGLTAAEATDILVATVREGNLEAASLANSLGPILGIAAEMGVRFSDLGAAIAIYTRLGVTAEQATTGLRATLTSLLTPTTDQAKAFAEMGISVEDLRQQIVDEGLAQALLSLTEAAKGNSQAIARAIPEARALSAVLGLTGGQADTLLASQDALRDSTGDLGDAFAGTKDSAAFKVDQFKVSLGELNRTLSQDLLPTLGPVVEGLTAVLETLSELSEVNYDLAAAPLAFMFKELAEAVGGSADGVAEVDDAMAGASMTAALFVASLPDWDIENAGLAEFAAAAMALGESFLPARDEVMQLQSALEGIRERIAVLNELGIGGAQLASLQAAETSLMKLLAAFTRLRQIDTALESHRKKLEAIEKQYRKEVDAIREWLKNIQDLEKNFKSFEDAADLGGGIMPEVDFSGLGAQVEEVFGGLDETIKDSVGGALDDLAKKDAEEFNKKWANDMTSSIATAFQSGLQGSGNAVDGFITTFASLLSTVVGGTVTAIILGAQVQVTALQIQAAAATAGIALAIGLAASFLSKLLGGDDAEEERKKQEKLFNELTDAVRNSMSSIRVEVISAFETILDILRLMGESARVTGEEMAAVNRELQGAVDAITGISTEDFADRLRAAMEFNETLLRLPQDIQEAFGEIDLSGLAESITAEFMGITSHLELAGLARDAKELGSAIKALGLGSKQTAALLLQVKDAERLRTQEIKAGALSQLADLMERAGIRSAEAARIRAQYEQLQFQVALKRLEVELTLLDLWTQATAAILADLGEFAGNIANFMTTVGAAGEAGNIPAPRIRAGGGRRQRRKDLNAELERLANESGTNNFIDRMRALHEQFAKLRKEARKLRVPLEKVNAAYENQVRILRDQALAPLRDFRDSLLSGQFGGVSMQQQFFMARSRFNSLARRAQAGDLDAISELGAAGQEYLDLARQMFGSTEQFKAIFDEVLNLVNGVLGTGGLKDEEAARHDQLIGSMEHSDTLRMELHDDAQDTRGDIRQYTQNTVRGIEDMIEILERMEAA